jgi:rod shape-determining protein MreC
MKWISNLFSRYWRNVHVGAICVLSLVLILGGEQLTGRVSGITVAVFYYPFSKIESTVTRLGEVDSANRDLQLLLVETSDQLSQCEEIKRENRRLRAVLGFEPPPAYSLLPAEVISVEGDQTPIAATINCSAGDSVLVDQPLINEQGLIGRVRTVYGDYATVQLLTDPAHRVAARVAESREMGIVKYRVSEGLILDDFPVQGSIKGGDLIISSGLGGVYPPGLIVGTVKSVERSEDEPFCRVKLTAAANFNSLEELFILRTDKR